MSEQPVTTDQPPEEKMSFTDKAAGVFYEPTNVFSSVKKSGVGFADWFVPVILLAILASVTVYVHFNSPELRYQSVQMMEQRIDQRVTEGKMTAEQAQQAKARVENSGSTFQVIGIFGAFVAVFIFFFIGAGIWWLIGKFALKGSITYTQAMGITGLTNWIAAVGMIVAIVMSVTMARLDGGLTLGMLTTMNMADKGYMILTRVNLFTIWSLFAASIGLAVIVGKKTLQAAVWVYGVWIAWTLISVFLLGGMFG